MTRDELIKLCRYYKGEDENPFDGGSIDALWWSGEKMLADNVSRDERFFQRMKDSLEEGLAAGDCDGVLIDSSIPIEKYCCPVKVFLRGEIGSKKRADSK